MAKTAGETTWLRGLLNENFNVEFRIHLIIIGVQFLEIGILVDILLNYYGQNRSKNYLT